MEAVTAYIEGPLCFVIMYGMMKKKPWRFTLQLAVSLGQAYGDVLYFATTCYEGMPSAIGSVQAYGDVLYFATTCYEGMLSAVCSVHMAPMWCCSASVVAWHDGVLSMLGTVP